MRLALCIFSGGESTSSSRLGTELRSRRNGCWWSKSQENTGWVLAGAVRVDSLLIRIVICCDRSVCWLEADYTQHTKRQESRGLGRDWDLRAVRKVFRGALSFSWTQVQRRVLWLGLRVSVEWGHERERAEDGWLSRRDFTGVQGGLCSIREMRIIREDRVSTWDDKVQKALSRGSGTWLRQAKREEQSSQAQERSGEERRGAVGSMLYAFLIWIILHMMASSNHIGDTLSQVTLNRTMRQDLQGQSAYSKAMQALQAKVRDYETQLQQQSESFSRERDTLEQERSEQYARLKEEYERQNREWRRVTEEQTSVQQEKERLKIDLDMLQRENAQIESNQNYLIEENKELIDNYIAQNEALDQQLAEARRQVKEGSQLNEELKNSRVQMGTNLQIQLEQCREQDNESKGVIQGLQVEMAGMQSMVETVQKHLVEARNENNLMASRWGKEKEQMTRDRDSQLDKAAQERVLLEKVLQEARALLLQREQEVLQLNGQLESSKSQVLGMQQEVKKRQTGKQKSKTTDLQEECEIGWPEREKREKAPQHSQERQEIEQNLEYLDRKYQSLQKAYQSGERTNLRKEMIDINSQTAYETSRLVALQKE